MNEAAIAEWQQSNQSYLSLCLAEVFERLKLLQAKANAEDIDAISSAKDRLSIAQQNRDKIASGQRDLSALHALSSAFRLSAFEQDLLLLCAGVELEARFMPLYADLQADPRKPFPTFSLALRALPGAHWSALLPAGPLRHWRLIEIGSGDALVSSPLRIDERVLHYLVGLSYLDERLRSLMHPVPIIEHIPPSHCFLAEQMARIFSKEGTEAPAVIQLCGTDREAKRSIAARALDGLGISLLSMNAEDIPTVAAERESLARLWEREAFLSNSALMVDFEELDRGEKMNAAISFLDNINSTVLTVCPQPLLLPRRSCIKLDVKKAGPEEQKEIWKRALGPAAGLLDGRLESLVSQFSLGMNEIQAASSQALAEECLNENDLCVRLWEACCSQSRPRLEDLAQRIEPAAGWDDLILPEIQIQVLKEIGVHVRQRAQVYDSWGFAGKGSRGLGISALFAGDSGTGKTMAAEVLASDLGLDLYRIDLSQVVSKYIGETEKNLRRVFDAAESGGAILLFDEADALFGKRSEVKDSHDRYANIEVSYLLQRMEAYRGLAILTTNMKSALDRAFLRRIRFVVQFPFPDAANRARIWKRIYPKKTPTFGLDYEQLSRLNVAGGNIRNIALYAAFLASDAGEPVKMRHLLRAARVEYAKMERAPTEGEIGGWV